MCNTVTLYYIINVQVILWSISCISKHVIILVRNLSNGHVDILASLVKLDGLSFCKLFENAQLFNALYAQRGRGYQLQQMVQRSKFGFGRYRSLKLCAGITYSLQKNMNLELLRKFYSCSIAT